MIRKPGMFATSMVFGRFVSANEAEAAKINVPTVLLAGELDQVDSIERHKTEVLAYIPNAEFKIVNGSGHLIPIDEPLQLANEIASFVGKLAP